VWVDEPATDANPRRETMLAYSIGGNPGAMRAGGGIARGGGGAMRAGGGIARGGGGAMRAGGAPLLSSDGQMVFFTDNPVNFSIGELFSIQSMAGLPNVPPGRTVVGQGYNLVASPGAVLPAGSVSIQYLADNVLVAGAHESDLTLYYFQANTNQWQALPTTRDAGVHLASAPSQGPGFYALMASVQLPLAHVGWNPIGYPVEATRLVTEALSSIAGDYTMVYGYVATDAVKPWKLYATGVPTYVNDLQSLSFGNSYWIFATVTNTLYLAPGPTNVSGPALLFSPPSTLYGRVVSGNNFTAAAGQSVSAWVNGVLCGQGVTQQIGNDIVYVVNVSAASPEDNFATCGWAGQRTTVTFRVNGQAPVTSGVWNNAVVAALDLNFTPVRLYLPLILR
jgi:hypothetical protein